MTFYQGIARHYDDIFPTGKAQLDFLMKAAGCAPSDILDIACGTGGYAAALASAGHHVQACDLDPAMVEQAAQKVGVKACLADMLNLHNALPDSFAAFDLVYCIGNSLVHLADEQEVGRALRQMAEVLRIGGQLVIQIINYDRILDQHIDGLPVIENKPAGVTFVRKYQQRSDGRISFNAELTVSGENNGQPLRNSVPLLPLRTKTLQRLCRESGFEQIRLYGSFKGDPFIPSASVPLILHAVRQAAVLEEQNPG